MSKRNSRELTTAEKIAQDPVKALQEYANEQILGTNSEEYDISPWMSEEVIEEEESSSEAHEDEMSTEDLVFAQPVMSEEEFSSEESSETEAPDEVNQGPEEAPVETPREIEMPVIVPERSRAPSPPSLPGERSSHRVPVGLLGVKSARWTGVHHSEELPPDEFLKEYIEREGASYAIFYRERCPSTGKLHYHSLILFNKAVSSHAVFRIDPNCHWEVVRGRLETIMRYISKDDDKVFEYGHRPVLVENALTRQPRRQTGQTQQERFQTLVTRARAGDITIMNDMIYARFRAFFDQLLAAAHPDIVYDGDLRHKNIWIHGPAGTGKSRMVWDMVTTLGLTIYVKIQNKWWDGYTDQKIVLMDDVTPEDVKAIKRRFKVHHWDVFPNNDH